MFLWKLPGRLAFCRLEMTSYQIHTACLDDLVGHDVDHPSLQRGWIRLFEKADRRVLPSCVELAFPTGQVSCSTKHPEHLRGNFQNLLHGRALPSFSPEVCTSGGHL